jgi:hypothetical protein
MQIPAKIQPDDDTPKLQQTDSEVLNARCRWMIRARRRIEVHAHRVQ